MNTNPLHHLVQQHYGQDLHYQVLLHHHLASLEGTGSYSDYLHQLLVEILIAVGSARMKNIEQDHDH